MNRKAGEKVGKWITICLLTTYSPFKAGISSTKRKFILRRRRFFDLSSSFITPEEEEKNGILDIKIVSNLVAATANNSLVV